jgi:FAD binding domain/Berberine and berberine like
MGQPNWPDLARQMRGQVLQGQARRALGVGKQLAAGRPLPQPRTWLRCSVEDDVRHALAFLQVHALPFAVRSGGHCFADLSSHGEVVLDLEPMSGLRLEGDTLVAGPGAQAAQFAPWLATRGRWLPSGGCPWVGLGGLALVGGFGLLGREAGLVCDRVESLRLVNAAAQVLHVDTHSHPELFWALRGAGAGQFGVVTELRLRTVPATAATVVHGEWPLDKALAVLSAWLSFAPQAPGLVNLECQLTVPDDDELPAMLELFGLVLAPATTAHEWLAPLRRALGPAAAALTLQNLGAEAVASYACGLLDRQCQPAWMPSRPYRDHGFQFTHSDFFDTLPGEPLLRELLAQLTADRRYAQHREIEFVPWGGAYAHGPDCAFGHRAAQLLVRHTSVVGRRADDALKASAQQWASASRATLAPAANGRCYQGYADLTLPQPLQAYHAAAVPRLQAIKLRYDPLGFFRHAQSVQPQSS